MNKKQTSMAFSFEQLQRAAYLNYLDRTSKGLPGSETEDWEKARVHLDLQIKQAQPPEKPQKASSKAGKRTSKTAAKPKSEAKGRKTPKSVSGSGPENLKVLNGLGPKIESRLHEAGITTLKQIASWKAADIEAISKKLRLGNRIAREKWVEQAKALVNK